jgi:hypothetical protein
MILSLKNEITSNARFHPTGGTIFCDVSTSVYLASNPIRCGVFRDLLEVRECPREGHALSEAVIPLLERLVFRCVAHEIELRERDQDRCLHVRGYLGHNKPERVL